MTPKAEVIVKQNKNYFKSIKCVGGGGVVKNMWKNLKGLEYISNFIWTLSLIMTQYIKSRPHRVRMFSCVIMVFYDYIASNLTHDVLSLSSENNNVEGVLFIIMYVYDK